MFAYHNLKVTFGGSLYTNKEIWVNALNFGLENESIGFESTDYNQSTVDEVATAVSAWFTSTGSGISQYARLEWVKIAFIDPNGNYYRDPLLFDFSTPPTGGATAANTLTLTTASAAISFATDRRRAPAKDGRIYPPMNVPTALANGEMQPTSLTTRLTAFKALIAAIETALSREVQKPKLIVASKVGAGMNKFVVKYRMGSVIDNQRSRKNKMPEQYTELGK